jgi:hypothetical protein
VTGWAVSVLSHMPRKARMWSALKAKYVPVTISELLRIPLVTWGATDEQVVITALSSNGVRHFRLLHLR